MPLRLSCGLIHPAIIDLGEVDSFDLVCILESLRAESLNYHAPCRARRDRGIKGLGTLPGQNEGSVMIEKFIEAVFSYCFSILEGFCAIFQRTHAAIGLSVPLFIMAVVHQFLPRWVKTEIWLFVLGPAAIPAAIIIAHGVLPDEIERNRENTTVGRQYKRGDQFPHEGFVQGAIERHSEKDGYSLDTSTYVDFLCTHQVTGEAWHIEAKGKTTAVALDLRTLLGQLLQRMSQQHVRHGIALLDMPQYRSQTEQVSTWVTDRLGLHWLFGAEDGTIEIVRPNRIECSSTA